ncbi:MAG TPA: enoyl-CoA hydratase-related protein, partial [Candidatus Limnocylindrales bacterium]
MANRERARATETPPPDHETVHVTLPAPSAAGPVDGVALVVLDRPKVLNALDFALIEALTDVLEWLDQEPACRCIVLTGAGERAFAAGADIAELAAQTPTTLTVEDHFHRWERIKRIRKPIVAAVRGYALGGGCELAMTCDLIVAGEDAQFGQPEIKLGVMPGAGGTQRLTRAIGKAKAMEMVLTGRNMTAREAEAHGLVTSVVPSEATVPAALELAAKIAAMAPVAAMAAKAAVNRAEELSLEAGL